MHNSSGSLVDFIDLRQYSNPSEFLEYARQNNYKIVAAEITTGSTDIHAYEFDFSTHTAIVLGNESSGVPNEILFNSDVVHIPLWGPGFCLNTSQTGTVFVSEYCRQYINKEKG